MARYNLIFREGSPRFPGNFQGRGSALPWLGKWIPASPREARISFLGGSGDRPSLRDGTQSASPPLGGGRPQLFWKIKNMVFKKCQICSNGDVSGWVRRIKNFCTIFEKSFFKKIQNFKDLRGEEGDPLGGALRVASLSTRRVLVSLEIFRETGTRPHN